MLMISPTVSLSLPSGRPPRGPRRPSIRRWCGDRSLRLRSRTDVRRNRVASAVALAGLAMAAVAAAPAQAHHDGPLAGSGTSIPRPPVGRRRPPTARSQSRRERDHDHARGRRALRVPPRQWQRHHPVGRIEHAPRDAAGHPGRLGPQPRRPADVALDRRARRRRSGAGLQRLVVRALHRRRRARAPVLLRPPHRRRGRLLTHGSGRRVGRELAPGRRHFRRRRRPALRRRRARWGVHARARRPDRLRPLEPELHHRRVRRARRRQLRLPRRHRRGPRLRPGTDCS